MWESLSGKEGRDHSKIDFQALFLPFLASFFQIRNFGLFRIGHNFSFFGDNQYFCTKAVHNGLMIWSFNAFLYGILSFFGVKLWIGRWLSYQRLINSSSDDFFFTVHIYSALALRKKVGMILSFSNFPEKKRFKESTMNKLLLQIPKVLVRQSKSSLHALAVVSIGRSYSVDTSVSTSLSQPQLSMDSEEMKTLDINHISSKRFDASIVSLLTAPLSFVLLYFL